jgi:hypothetical protein
MGGFVIGIAVGGTKVALTAADPAGRRLSESRFSVSEAGGAQEGLSKTVCARPILPAGSPAVTGRRAAASAPLPAGHTLPQLWWKACTSQRQ